MLDRHRLAVLVELMTHLVNRPGSLNPIRNVCNTSYIYYLLYYSVTVIRLIVTMEISAFFVSVIISDLVIGKWTLSRSKLKKNGIPINMTFVNDKYENAFFR